MNIIEIKNLTKKYDEKSAVGNTSFEEIKGRISGFLKEGRFLT
ncbi:MAG: hypothetical protein RBS85_02895 [Methanofastidiosum sp.]|jgi:ABC-type uncharacterized transport system ATPase subunit|nr:hypothetical protein [Methanofastidiosum sp.]